ncbi:hypothetical protein B0H66DRAFT_366973 [Apodospora peruviana]|uniref:Uncharacterized protein n=1 Tax=Apodospora peruviana TaxID=516989 RepID=A0AAE0M006_9PEZI|nr:hypothetical protein B0H66DRAFT_366973 [Apodospora peruviana]
MFGNLTHLMHAAPGRTEAPADVPPPTPVNFPRCFPQDRPHDPPAPGQPAKPLTSVLQGIIRPTEINISHLEALGTRVISDSAPAELIPDPSFIPDFDAWHALSPDDAHAANESTRKRLNTGNLSPGCQTYLERKRELEIPNNAAYRTVRRIPTPKGQTQARLGNSFEFFRHLELFSTYWDDTSKPPRPKPGPDGATAGQDSADSNGSDKSDFDASLFYRTGTGYQMPPEYRQNILTAFLKLVAYDYGCNVSAPRTEPRLYITSNSSPGTGPSRNSYFSSGCTFIFRTPTTREAARAGIVEGPLAAVSARHTTSFPPPRPAPAIPTSPSATSSALASDSETTNKSVVQTSSTNGSTSGGDRDSTLDLARELIAALITAQHRAREGRAEKRIGEGAWWATKPRWGGGPGGPIGREVEMQSGDAFVGDKDEPPLSSAESLAVVPPTPSGGGGGGEMSLPRRPGAAGSSQSWASVPGNMGSAKGAKRLKKSGNLAIYDSYRMVRPPAAAWDKKTKYAAIGRTKGADYDDVFVISALFHHISVLRVRVPDRLLAVLDGGEDEAAANLSKSWAQLEVRRSPWYDLFKVDDRLAAMQLVWSMMAYLMREENEGADGAAAAQETKPGEQDGQGDVRMGNN